MQLARVLEQASDAPFDAVEAMLVGANTEAVVVVVDDRYQSVCYSTDALSSSCCSTQLLFVDSCRWLKHIFVQLQTHWRKEERISFPVHD